MKKRVISFLLSLVMVLSLVPGVVFAASLIGDADDNGDVDYLDAMLVLQYHTGIVGDDALNPAVCDADGSGEVDYLDAMLILQYHTGVLPEIEPESPAKPTEPIADPYKYVVIIGVDGAGAYFDDADTPWIDHIFQDGAKTNKMLTSTPTVSAPCWASLIHGVTPEFHGIEKGNVTKKPYDPESPYPSFFRVIRENDANAKLASFCHWDPINIGIIEDNIGVHKVGNMYDPRLSDSQLTYDLLAYLRSNNPTALFVQYDEADGYGHVFGFGSDLQLEKISELDACIGLIYLSYKMKGILDDTLFIVTSDHGGNGRDHGGPADTEKYVMFAACGKNVEKGEIQDMEIHDTAAVVLYALGYSIPDTWTGRVPSGLFKGVTAAGR